MLIAIAGLIWSVVAGGAEPAAAPEVAAEQKPEAPPAEDLSTTAEPRVRTSPSAQQPVAGATGAGGAAAGAKDKRVGPVGPDRLQLDTTIVQGNRELPKVLYIVPWKKADIGELPSQPFNSLLDEALAPVDRDVFRREVTYYGVISGTSAAPQEPAAARQQ
jgi:hypothetical protein